MKSQSKEHGRRRVAARSRSTVSGEPIATLQVQWLVLQRKFEEIRGYVRAAVAAVALGDEQVLRRTWG